MSSPSFVLNLFGPFAARFNDQPFTGFATDKVRALLAYLSIEPSQAHRRDTLAALFWPDYPQETALRNLRQAIYRLRLSLQEMDPSLPDRLISQTRRTVTLNPAALTLDTAQFTQLLQAAKTSPEPISLLSGIIPLYRGELLKGFYIQDAYAFDEWLGIQRELFQQQALDAVSRLVTLHEAGGDPVAVLSTAKNMLLLDPYHEKTHRQIMRAHLELDNRPQAIAQYHKLQTVLRDELGIEPDPATKMLYEQARVANTPIIGEEVTGERPLPLHHFPTALTPFVGRKAELDYLSQTVQDPACRLLTITGPGGMGKTRLGVETARRLSAQSSRFRDGLFFISLAQVENDGLFIAAIARSLTLSLPPGVEPQQALHSYLKTRRLLLMLDNFEHLLGRKEGAPLPVALAFLADILAAAPGVNFLITSREPLALQGEWVYALGGLPYVTNSGETSGAALDLPAPQLFIQCARRYRPAFDPAAQAEAIGEICRLTGGLPLALEIAAAWMRSYDCQEIAHLIAQGLDFLTNPYRDAPVRQRSIRAIFTSTWEQLNPEQQNALAAMSVFRGGFTVPAAVSVAQTSVLHIANLVEKSLLRRAEGRHYDLHELVHQFAAEKLVERGGETAVFSRHATFYLTLLREQYPGFNGPMPQEAIALVRQTIDNIRAAWQWAITNRQFDLLQPVIEAFAQYLVLTGSGREGEEAFAQALHSLQQVPADDPKSLIVQSLLASHLAWFQIGLGKNQAALEHVTTALALAERSGDLSSRAYALSILGWDLQIQSQYGEAETALSEAVTLFEQTSNPLQASLALIRLGSLYWRKREFARTLPYYQQSLQIEQRLQNRRGMNRAYGGIGLVYEFMEGFDEALFWLQKALNLDRELENWLGVIRNLGNIGSLYYKLGEYQQALLCYQEAIKIEQESQRKSDLGTWLGAMGNIYLRLGEQELAMEQYNQAIALHEETGDRFNLCAALLGKGELLLLRGEYAPALVLIRQGKQLAAEVLREGSLFRADLLESWALGKMGKTEEAQQQLHGLLPDLHQSGNSERLAHVYDLLWQLDNSAAYARQALAAYQAAMAHIPKKEYHARIEALTDSLAAQGEV
jgi:predicted ATPase/DNA-binding SARP family transcriptional activator/Tfp pilus assembly protein PilF